jgi:hypothetical protein
MTLEQNCRLICNLYDTETWFLNAFIKINRLNVTYFLKFIWRFKLWLVIFSEPTLPTLFLENVQNYRAVLVTISQFNVYTVCIAPLTSNDSKLNKFTSTDHAKTYTILVPQDMRQNYLGLQLTTPRESPQKFALCYKSQLFIKEHGV